MKKQNMSLAIAMVCLLTISSVALGAGYEKTALWSAKNAGVAGAVTASTSDADALYFNPAGLAASKGFNVNAHFSPTLSKFKGPITTTTQLESKQSFLPLGGLLASYSPMEKLGIGAGFYVGGGSTVRYEGVDYSGYSAAFTTAQVVETKLQMLEGSIGAGYEIMEGLKVGAAWRMAMVSADFTAANTPTSLSPTHKLFVAANYAGLKKNKFDGFRLGLQYAPKDSIWGVGLSYRSKVSFKVAGTSSFVAKSNLLGDVTSVGGAVEIESQLPQALTLGGYFDVMDKKLRIFPEYGYTDYGSVRQLAVTGSSTVTAPAALVAGLGTAATSALPNINQNWKPQHAFKLGAEYSGCESMTFRGGYAVNTQVTPTTRARATFVAPGLGHSIILGAGTTFMEKKLGADIAADYSFAKGDGTNELLNTGSFSSTAMTAHLSLSYNM